MTLLACLILAATALSGFAVLVAGTMPALTGTGLLIAGLAPLAFIVTAACHRIGLPRRHPLLISCASGLGCVLVLVGSYRFGDVRQWAPGLAVLALATWMAWQRRVWRRSDHH